MFSIHFWLQ